MLLNYWSITSTDTHLIYLQIKLHSRNIFHQTTLPQVVSSTLWNYVNSIIKFNQSPWFYNVFYEKLSWLYEILHVECSIRVFNM